MTHVVSQISSHCLCNKKIRKKYNKLTFVFKNSTKEYSLIIMIVDFHIVSIYFDWKIKWNELKGYRNTSRPHKVYKVCLIRATFNKTLIFAPFNPWIQFLDQIFGLLTRSKYSVFGHFSRSAYPKENSFFSSKR